MNKLHTLTKEALTRLYLNERRSLEDIGRLYNASRVAVYKKLKRLGMKQRSKSEARLEAQKQGKLPQQFFDINAKFFSSWSAKMAYVLGLIVTDGCISKTGTVSVCIRNRELLEKVKKAMEAKHNITLSKHQKGLYYFHFARKRIVQDLKKLGILPRKSLKVKFPSVPPKYLSDFIRGIFDGGGSVFFKSSPTLPLRSRFISGSKEFIEELERKLNALGMPKRTIYKQKTKNGWSFNFVYDHKDNIKLFEILYKNTQNRLFLERKYKRFLIGMKGR